MADEKCPLCSQPMETDTDLALQACSQCAKRIGIIPMPPSRRRPTPCTRCNGRQFIRAIPREHSSVRSGEANGQVSAPMYVTHAPTSHRGWVLAYVNPIPIEETGVGLLETYICRTCGFVEWYCVDVERVPIHPHLMTEAIDLDGESPYRD